MGLVVRLAGTLLGQPTAHLTVCRPSVRVSEVPEGFQPWWSRGVSVGFQAGRARTIRDGIRMLDLVTVDQSSCQGWALRKDAPCRSDQHRLSEEVSVCRM